MNVIKKMIMAIVVIVGVNKVNAQNVNTNENKVANNGYDVVNYFTTNFAARGSVEFSTTNNGATYYFVNSENLNAFKSNPSKFLPQYDGYCAFAVAKMNKKVPVNPETFRIDDGKLYLFYNDFWEGKPFNTIVPWLNNEAEMERLAETNWKTLKNN
ncbi:MAG: YHS domain protein [Bacteroidetes bacterium HGW-Bacteroidetes-12]|nr:MAG: YHS domain protein [Bacteroidetes bacterium HGW-Bacteroidetes-12]